MSVLLLLLSENSQSAGEETNSAIVKTKQNKTKQIGFMKTFLTKTRTIPARRVFRNERLLLYTFVILKAKNVLTEWSCAGRLPGSTDTKVEFWNFLSEDAHKFKRKYELFLFDFFIACNFMFFFCTDPCVSRDLMSK